MSNLVLGLGRPRWMPRLRRKRSEHVLEPRTVPCPKEQTRFRSMRFRSQKRTGDTTDTCAASSSGRNRTVRAGLSSKPPWAPLCNRQPSNYIIIVCNYSISSNDRSPPNPAVDKQALILPSTNRRFAIEFQAVRSCCSSAMPL